MNQFSKKQIIIAGSVVAVLLLVAVVYLLTSKSRIEPATPLTDQERIRILNQLQQNNADVKTPSLQEKTKILDSMEKKAPASTLTNEDRMKILEQLQANQ